MWGVLRKGFRVGKATLVFILFHKRSSVICFAITMSIKLMIYLSCQSSTRGQGIMILCIYFKIRTCLNIHFPDLNTIFAWNLPYIVIFRFNTSIICIFIIILGLFEAFIF